MNYSCANVFRVCNLTLPCSKSSEVIHLNQIENLSSDDIFTVSNRVPQNSAKDLSTKYATISKSHCNLHVPSEEEVLPATVHKTHSHMEPYLKSTYTSTIKVAKSSGFEHEIFNKRSKLVKDLMLSVNNEPSYICHFIRLIESENDPYERICQGKFPKESDEVVIKRVERLDGIGNHVKRINLRLNILKELKESVINEDIYLKVLSDLVVMEEKFMKDVSE